jgi:hypothetical protein
MTGDHFDHPAERADAIRRLRRTVEAQEAINARRCWDLVTELGIDVALSIIEQVPWLPE